MDIHGFASLTLDQLSFEPTDQQIKLVAALARFCSAYTPQDSVFVFNGYAGTGKTSVMGALVRSLRAVGLPTVLLASTGRAAKVLAGFTGMPAHTIHRKIYSPPTASGGWYTARVADNPHVNTVFIVDEASMIGGADSTGNLLADLLMYVFSGTNCRLILLGDTAQLPPVGLTHSPAMDADVLRQMGMHVTRATITRTVRQKSRSGILYNATALRRALQSGNLQEPTLTVSRFNDVAVADPYELEDAFRTAYSTYGEGQTILITRSNRRASEFNMAIRHLIYDREEILCRGERLIVAKNNYYWCRRSVIAQNANLSEGEMLPPPSKIDFVANGEAAVVERIYATEQRAGMLFADAQLWLPDYDTLIDAKLVLDSLGSDAPALTAEQQEKLAEIALADAGISAGEGTPTAVRNALKNSPYYNALVVKYAYAVTCHKAQGGQWDAVFVDMGYIPPEVYASEDFFRWLYTAVTRARTRLWFINPAVPIK